MVDGYVARDDASESQAAGFVADRDKLEGGRCTPSSSSTACPSSGAGAEAGGGGGGRVAAKAVAADRAGAAAPATKAGALLEIAFEDVLRLIEIDCRHGVRAARGFPLHCACEPNGELLDYLDGVLEGRRDWRCVMNKRIGISYKEKNPALVWLDDKVEQVSRTATLLGGQERHLPIYGHASVGLATEADLEALRAVVEAKADAGECMVVKPRHGSNSKHVSTWLHPKEADKAKIAASLDKAMDAWDRSWKKESWNQNAVPKGVLLQPFYAPMVDFLPDVPTNSDGVVVEVSARLRKPLELKVQVLFGEVLGACLNTHPQFLWVSREGAVHVWDQALPGFLARHAGTKEPLPEAIVDVLRRELERHWAAIRSDSEQLVRSIGLDELRVDWLLGDTRWGPRIGELTYMGTFALDIVPVSKRVARAYAAAHMTRLGRAVRDGSF